MIKIISWVVFSTQITHAASGGHHAPGEIPVREIFFQCLNFFLLCAILYFVLRNKVRAFMAARHEQLNSAVTEAKRAREAAEAAYADIQQKLKNFDLHSQQVLEQAKRESVELRNKIKEDAARAAANIEAEAKRTAESEVAKANAKIYEDVVTQALEGARSLLGSSVEEPDQRRLQKEFVQKIEAVQ